jgi:hypothetical protein
MLARLIAFGEDKGFFTVKALGQLDKSCCSKAQTAVIDFDDTKARMTETAPLHQPKSADALKILPQLNRIDFIELKGFEQFVHHQKDAPDIDTKINQQIAKFCLADKIKDSLFVLAFLIKLKEFRCTIQENQQYRQASKNYLVVVDIDLYDNPMKDRLVTLDFLSENTSRIKDKIARQLQQAVDDIPASSLENLQPPKLLSCKKIDAYYQRLLSGFAEGRD